MMLSNSRKRTGRALRRRPAQTRLLDRTEVGVIANSESTIAAAAVAVTMLRDFVTIIVFLLAVPVLFLCESIERRMAGSTPRRKKIYNRVCLQELLQPSRRFIVRIGA